MRPEFKSKSLQAFNDYAGHFDTSDISIKLKISHTFRVADLAERIADSIGADCEFAWELGMLHDIGRFEQVSRYGTFVDAESVDHAELGADILFRDGLISSFPLTEPERVTMAEIAIREHNKLAIPEDLDADTKTFCNILRDADKADIFRVLTEPPYDARNRRVEADSRSDAPEPARREIMECIYDHRCVPRKYKRTEFEMVISSCFMAFELVYPETVRIVREQGYLDKLLDMDLKDPVMKDQLEVLKQNVYPGKH